uniref:Uncharacterized protein n=1 Tax=Syphacia muris TaxID=451379 RepID=A0A0N5AZK7_9BILA
MSEARVPLSTKATLLRLIKNMCQHKEIAASMIYFTLDSVVQFLISDDRNIGSVALSIVRTLVSLNFASVSRCIYQLFYFKA